MKHLFEIRYVAEYSVRFGGLKDSFRLSEDMVTHESLVCIRE